MGSWFNWRTAVASIVSGAVPAVALFSWAGETFSLSGLDLFFAITTVVSLGFNGWQLVRDRYKYAPLTNSLIGLSNDLKGRGLRAHQRQLVITSSEGMKLSVEAVRLEFYDFVGETFQNMEQLREHVVAAIKTLKPDITNEQVFRAAEFGLNEQELELRRESMQRFVESTRRRAAGDALQDPAPAQVAAPGPVPEA